MQPVNVSSTYQLHTSLTFKIHLRETKCQWNNICLLAMAKKVTRYYVNQSTSHGAGPQLYVAASQLSIAVLLLIRILMVHLPLQTRRSTADTEQPPKPRQRARKDTPAKLHEVDSYCIPLRSCKSTPTIIHDHTFLAPYLCWPQEPAVPVQTEQKQQNKGPQSLYLLKSEPHEFSIDDLASRKEQTEPWDGVRNYQAIPLPTTI